MVVGTSKHKLLKSFAYINLSLTLIHWFRCAWMNDGMNETQCIWCSPYRRSTFIYMYILWIAWTCVTTKCEYMWYAGYTIVFTESANGPNRKNGFCDFSSDFMANKRIDGVPNTREAKMTVARLCIAIYAILQQQQHMHTQNITELNVPIPWDY